MICGHTQCKQKQTNILQNRTSQSQVSQEGCIPLPLHYWAIPQDNTMVHQVWSNKNN